MTTPPNVFSTEAITSRLNNDTGNETYEEPSSFIATANVLMSMVLGDIDITEEHKSQIRKHQIYHQQLSKIYARPTTETGILLEELDELIKLSEAYISDIDILIASVPLDAGNKLFTAMCLSTNTLLTNFKQQQTHITRREAFTNMFVNMANVAKGRKKDD